MSTVLVIEDDEVIRSNVLDLLEAEGFEGIGAADGEAGVAFAVQHLPDLVICDVAMPGIDGYEVLEILSAKPSTAVIPFVFLSARAERADVRRGMALGADDYLTKPFTRVELLDAIRIRLERSRARSVAPAAPARLNSGARATAARGSVASDSRVVAADPIMQALFAQVQRIAPSPLSVLILGETGVGKEVVAECLHRASGRRGRFVALNCAALPESLLESELFGHDKGAFTGAVSAKEGLLETAEAGTVFLDEVGELPLATQVKLLRVLEDHKVRRVGGREARALDVRIVSATHRDIEREATERGSFRLDLFYRLSGMTFEVPPLRERPADLLQLAQHFLEKAGEAMKRVPAPQLSAAALAQLKAHNWPGNIRELRNVLERALLLCDGAFIELEHLPAKLLAHAAASSDPLAPLSAAGDPREQLLSELERLERQRITQALADCGGNQGKAAELLGISRRTLVTRLAEFALPRPRKRP